MRHLLVLVLLGLLLHFQTHPMTCISLLGFFCQLACSHIPIKINKANQVKVLLYEITSEGK